MATRFRYTYSHGGGSVSTIDFGQLISDNPSNPLLGGKNEQSFADVKAYIEGAAPNGLAQTIDTYANGLDILISKFDADTSPPPVGRSGLIIQDEGVALATAATTLNFVGAGVQVTGTGATKTITISGSSAPSSGPNDFRYGLSTQSAPASVDFASLTDVASPTDPQTVTTGVTTAGDYFHIFSANTHTVQTITDTVLQQIVYQDGGTGNIFTKTADARTESSVTYDAYTIGPLNAGVNEEYVVRFS